MQLTTYFSLEEFVATQQRGIDNTLPEILMPEATKTCQMLERIRTALGLEKKKTIPIHINSGFRCRELNAKVGGQINSDHLTAKAVDWIAPKFGTPAQIAKFLAPRVGDLNIGQLIREYAPDSGGGWVHTSTKFPANPINRIITIDRNGVRAGV